ncbi:MAG: hypothetical protein LBC96_08310 [Lachnospiraceae bacterium]|jgi:hypothetical protein|nr:hypothetical protein [Lachnospiraceae bacterium]
MNFFLLASSIAFMIWLTVRLAMIKKNEAEQEKEFWDTEQKANTTRRKSLDDLDYIQIPFDDLPFALMSDDQKVSEYHQTLRTLAENPIVNLTCITNTDLKLRYGAANITKLSRYDSAYTILARTLQQWAKALFEAGLSEAACTVLEFAVATKTDVSDTYLLLSDIYHEAGKTESIESLISIAEELPSSHSRRITARLREKLDV